MRGSIMSTAHHLHVSEAEYLAYDLANEGRHEYLSGDIVAMAGAEPRHDRVVTNLHIALGLRLRGTPCRSHTADQRVRFDETGLYAYPDLSVVCGSPVYADTHPRTLLNPTLVVEVLSKSTASWDAVKAAHYRRRASVRAYVLVSIPDRRVELYERRPDDRWLLTTFLGDAILGLGALDIALPLSELWDGVAELPEE
jgi:Uma2 family endonuclease